MRTSLESTRLFNKKYIFIFYDIKLNVIKIINNKYSIINIFIFFLQGMVRRGRSRHQRRTRPRWYVPFPFPLSLPFPFPLSLPPPPPSSPLPFPIGKTCGHTLKTGTFCDCPPSCSFVIVTPGPLCNHAEAAGHLPELQKILFERREVTWRLVEVRERGFFFF